MLVDLVIGLAAAHDQQAATMQIAYQRRMPPNLPVAAAIRPVSPMKTLRCCRPGRPCRRRPGEQVIV